MRSKKDKTLPFPGFLQTHHQNPDAGSPVTAVSAPSARDQAPRRGAGDVVRRERGCDVVTFETAQRAGPSPKRNKPCLKFSRDLSKSPVQFGSTGHAESPGAPQHLHVPPASPVYPRHEERRWGTRRGDGDKGKSSSFIRPSPQFLNQPSVAAQSHPSEAEAWRRNCLFSLPD